jgi:hypothetical protein
MKDNTVLTLTKVVAVLYAFFGALAIFTTITVLIAIVTVGYGEALATSIGRDVGSFPYAYAIIGMILTAVLGVVYVVGSFALFKKKPWAYQVVGTVGVLGIILGLSSVVFGAGVSIMDFVWGTVYLAFAYLLYTKKHLFK